MKRSGFKRKQLERKRAVPIAMREKRGVMMPQVCSATACGVVAVSRGLCNKHPESGALAFPKEAFVRSADYRRYVASLQCWLCGAFGRSQAAHADEGKGMSIKSDDRTCYPLCGPDLRGMGCHHAMGQSGVYPREQRRSMEKQAALDTRKALVLRSMSDPVLHALLVKLEITT